MLGDKVMLYLVRLLLLLIITTSTSGQQFPLNPRDNNNNNNKGGNNHHKSKLGLVDRGTRAALVQQNSTISTGKDIAFILPELLSEDGSKAPLSSNSKGKTKKRKFKLFKALWTPKGTRLPTNPGNFGQVLALKYLDDTVEDPEKQVKGTVIIKNVARVDIDGTVEDIGKVDNDVFEFGITLTVLKAKKVKDYYSIASKTSKQKSRQAKIFFDTRNKRAAFKAAIDNFMRCDEQPCQEVATGGVYINWKKPCECPGIDDFLFPLPVRRGTPDNFPTALGQDFAEYMLRQLHEDELFQEALMFYYNTIPRTTRNFIASFHSIEQATNEQAVKLMDEKRIERHEPVYATTSTMGEPSGDLRRLQDCGTDVACKKRWYSGLVTLNYGINVAQCDSLAPLTFGTTPIVEVIRRSIENKLVGEPSADLGARGYVDNPTAKCTWRERIEDPVN